MGRMTQIPQRVPRGASSTFIDFGLGDVARSCHNYCSTDARAGPRTRGCVHRCATHLPLAKYGHPSGAAEILASAHIHFIIQDSLLDVRYSVPVSESRDYMRCPAANRKAQMPSAATVNNTHGC